MLKRFHSRLARDESGATAVEYGLILALIALVIIGALRAFSSAGNVAFDTLRIAMTG
ncbi:MAG: Flp family type IVb pilin [Brevundimonas sp.]